LMILLRPDDNILWAMFRQGNNDALALIYSDHSKKLYLYGLKLTSNRTVIEDSIQDLFSDLVKNRKNLGDTDNIHFYLIKSFKRKLQRQLQKESRYDLNSKVEDFIFDITYSIDHELINKESADQRMSLLSKALNGLSPRQKEAVYLKISEELEYEQVAEIMEISIESCRNLISKAIKSMKDTLHPKAFGFAVILRKLFTSGQ